MAIEWKKFKIYLSKWLIIYFTLIRKTLTYRKLKTLDQLYQPYVAAYSLLGKVYTNRELTLQDCILTLTLAAHK